MSNLSAPSQRKGMRSNRHFILTLLMLVYAFNFLDRQLLAILTEPIQRELHFTDTELGLLGGLAFAFLYSMLAVPIARLADKSDRRKIIGAALATWSLFTALCGAAQGFGAFLIARIGVGVGEAGGVAPSHAIISQIYPSHERGRAMAVLSAGAPIGSALGLLAGGYLAVNFGWRATFLIIGAAGVLIAPLLLVIHDPTRMDAGAAGLGDNPAGTMSLGRVFAIMRRMPTFWLVSVGTGTGTMLATGFQFWLPAFLQRSHGLKLTEAAQLLSIFAIVCGASGLLVGGWLSDRMSRISPRAYALVPALAFLLPMPFMLAALWVKSILLAIILLVIPQTLSLTYIGPSVATIQQIAPPRARATASALFLLIANLIGIGFGSLVMGALSDFFTSRFGADGLRYAIMASATTLYPIATLAYWKASHSINGDWNGDADETS